MHLYAAFPAAILGNLVESRPNVVGPSIATLRLLATCLTVRAIVGERRPTVIYRPRFPSLTMNPVPSNRENEEYMLPRQPRAAPHRALAT
jgi:hypothetical protein